MGMFWTWVKVPHDNCKTVCIFVQMRDLDLLGWGQAGFHGGHCAHFAYEGDTKVVLLPVCGLYRRTRWFLQFTQDREFGITGNDA
jgi:hypothetical protein